MGAVTDEITDEIDQLSVRETAPGMAQVAIALAESMDSTDGATPRANAARELRAVMDTLRKLAPVATEGDSVDDITAQRQKRRAAAREQAASGD
ncbi:hypothetical protein ACOKM5_23375 [Streptomyces sp. BH097]|uniref:hypothetical protein n=1 Tax=unclassified Streptomyces TaxID=2593676 RepID=UPI003BB5477A